MTEFSPQERAIAVAPKLTALASAIGSGFIVLEIARDSKQRTAFHRILLGMCLADLLSSVWFFLGTWPVPRGTEGVYGAVGNTGSCVAQGFFSQLSVATACYNASLSVFYLLTIREGWSEGRVRSKAEPWLHGIPIVIGLGTSFAGVALDSYNSDHWECWIAPLPTDCHESWEYGDEGDCERGDNASLYRWILYYAFVWLSIFIVTFSMVAVYRSVRAKEDAVNRHNSLLGNKYSNKVLVQGYWYCGAFYATWIFPTITRFLQVIVQERTPLWLITLTATFVPIQGFLNFIVYIRPRYKKYQAVSNEEV